MFNFFLESYIFIYLKNFDYGEDVFMCFIKGKFLYLNKCMYVGIIK